MTGEARGGSVASRLEALNGKERTISASTLGAWRQHHRPRAVGGSGLGLLLALPAIALLALFILWPIVTAVRYSTTSASGFGDMDPVGVQNYVQAVTDPELLAALLRNVVFAAIVVTASVIVGFVLAYLLLLRVRGWRPLQVLFMVPYVMPVVVTALLWQFLLEPTSGLVNTALRALHLDALASGWLTAESSALGSVSLVQSWVTVPFAMLLLFGAMVSLPQEVMEAADLDGAGHAVKMFRIVLPMIRPTVVLVVFVLTVQLFRSFDLVYLLTQGGPIASTTIATLYVFVTGFVDNEYGFANALGIVIGLLLVLLALVPTVAGRVRARRRRQQEGDLR